MRILRALSQRSVVKLWSGQSLSAIGDEIFRVALIWMFVNRIGANAGYLAAAQAGAVLVMSLIGGALAEQWNPRRTMIRVDMLRAGIVLIPMIWSHFAEPSLILLCAVALSLSGLSAFFEPALQTLVPAYVRGRELRQASNALMGTTLRLARVVGPGIVAALVGLIPMVQFFSLDSATFLVSALSILSLPAVPNTGEPGAPRRGGWLGLSGPGLRDALAGGYLAVREHALVSFIVVAKAFGSGCWTVALTLGFALLVHDRSAGDIRALGFLYSAYGVGNLAGVLLLGSITMRRPGLVLFGGNILMGASFIGVALAPNLPTRMLLAALAAVGGPLNDLPFVDLVQSTFAVRVIPRVFRLLMAAEYTGMLVCLLGAPTLYHAFSTAGVIAGAGGAMMTMGLVGVFRFRREFFGAGAEGLPALAAEAGPLELPPT